MTWIESISFSAATGKLKLLYEKYKRANNTVANIISAHALRPHLMEGHMAFYRAALGHSNNTSPLWLMEAIGVYVSALNGCNYCINHHSHFGEQAYDNQHGPWEDLAAALIEDRPADILTTKEQSIMDYAKQLTLSPRDVEQSMIEAMRSHGVSDGEILEVNQVVGYFSYANRTILGLGITLKGEVYAD
ncbi:carboxymuconolactone decarboxylase family protein [Maritalea sp.]|uniref:carboxymuconolactone decarboxylase family protein n=1 Tax=Maritalea sp. TaxID=2003361 RepID=UPI003EF1D271